MKRNRELYIILLLHNKHLYYFSEKRKIFFFFFFTFKRVIAATFAVHWKLFCFHMNLNLNGKKENEKLSKQKKLTPFFLLFLRGKVFYFHQISTIYEFSIVFEWIVNNSAVRKHGTFGTSDLRVKSKQNKKETMWRAKLSLRWLPTCQTFANYITNSFRALNWNEKRFKFHSFFLFVVSALQFACVLPNVYTFYTSPGKCHLYHERERIIKQNWHVYWTHPNAKWHCIFALLNSSPIPVSASKQYLTRTNKSKSAIKFQNFLN